MDQNIYLLQLPALEKLNFSFYLHATQLSILYISTSVGSDLDPELHLSLRPKVKRPCVTLLLPCLAVFSSCRYTGDLLKWIGESNCKLPPPPSFLLLSHLALLNCHCNLKAKSPPMWRKLWFSTLVRICSLRGGQAHNNTCMVENKHHKLKKKATWELDCILGYKLLTKNVAYCKYSLKMHWNELWLLASIQALKSWCFSTVGGRAGGRAHVCRHLFSAKCVLAISD